MAQQAVARREGRAERGLASLQLLQDPLGPAEHLGEEMVELAEEGEGGPRGRVAGAGGQAEVLAAVARGGIGGLGVLVGLGFYLPFNIVLTYTIGTLLRLAADAWAGAAWSEDVGIPLAAGLIVGEALVGVAYSMVIVFGA